MPSPFYTTGPRNLIRALLGTSNVNDIDAGFLAMATDVETKMLNYASGLASAMGAAGVDGRVYRQTDTGLRFIDNGTTWDLLGSLRPRSVSVSTTARNGDLVEYGGSGGHTITLPSPVLGTVVGVIASGAVTGASQLAIATPSGFIAGIGVGAASFGLGTPNSFAVLVADGTNWVIIGGGQDTGWVAFTLGGTTVARAGAYMPSVRLRGDTVTLRGVVDLSGTLIGTVAAGFRPTATVFCNGQPSAYISVSTAGAMNLTGGGSQANLDGANWSIS